MKIPAYATTLGDRGDGHLVHIMAYIFQCTQTAKWKPSAARHQWLGYLASTGVGGATFQLRILVENSFSWWATLRFRRRRNTLLDGRHVNALPPFQPLETPHGPASIGGAVKTAQDIVVMRVV